MKLLTKSFIAVAIICYIFIISCNISTNKTGNNSNSEQIQKAYPNITVTVVGSSPEFPDAQIDLASVKTEKKGKDSAMVSFIFNVKNYELKNQTGDAQGKMCNNSAMGQHIHFILDNQPYQALYEPKNDIVVAKNSEHYLMAFLSRSYHESLKSEGAALLYHFKIDDKGNLVKLDVPKTPMIFYSRPKGTYIGKDTENILLDFYGWNANLSDGNTAGIAAYTGNYVKVDISNEDIKGHDTSFTVNAWKPYFIHNLGMGKCKITLTLLDNSQKPLSGDNTTVTRNFTLAAEEPMKK
jgi:hypothetical protein